MESLEQLRRRLDAAEDLQSVVRTMKAIAAVGIRQYERAAESLTEYDRAVHLGLRAVFRSLRPDMTRSGGVAEQGEPIGVVVGFGSDQGMCGQLNDRVAQRVEELARSRDTEPVLIVSGGRLASLVRASVGAVAAEVPTARAIDGVAGSAGRLLEEIEAARGERREASVQLVFPRRTSGAGYEVRSRRILPLDRRWIDELSEEPWPTRRIPAWPGDRREVLRAFIREHLFVSLYRALVDALASEHASRLSSMQSAERNIEERLDELGSRYSRRRQSSITEELMDIIAGFEALAKEEDQ